MLTSIAGLHHITAIASDPQRNLDFYTQVLGLRFVKRTINFDDSGTYHFYFGDDVGAPGTILTFFPWPNAGKGRVGAGEVIATAFSIPAGSLSFWSERLRSKGVVITESRRFGSPVLSLSDPDGMILELIEHAEKQVSRAPRYSDIQPSFAIRGFYGVTLLEWSLEGTERVLHMMGVSKVAEEAGSFASPRKGRPSAVLLILRSMRRPHGAAWVREPFTTSPSATRMMRRRPNGERRFLVL